METKVQFQFMIAGVTLRVQCCCAGTRAVCGDFLVDDDTPADAQIVITPEDHEKERAFLLSKKRRGEDLEASTPEALERLVLCRRAAELLPRYGAVLFHGSALALDGQGVLFTAASGTGKSTHTALWRREINGVEMVNDDKPFLRLQNDQILVCGSPWMGKHRLGANISVPLKAICLLQRGEKNSIHPVTAREALPMLLQQTYRNESPEMLMHTLKIMDRVSSGTELYRLACNMEPEAARVAARGIFMDREETL